MQYIIRSGFRDLGKDYLVSDTPIELPEDTAKVALREGWVEEAEQSQTDVDQIQGQPPTGIIEQTEPSESIGGTGEDDTTGNTEEHI